MRDSRRCPKCSFHEILFVPSIPDRSEGPRFAAPLAVGMKPKEGWLPGMDAIGQFAACTCRSCGFTEIYAWRPELLPVEEIPGAQLLVGKPASPYR